MLPGEIMLGGVATPRLDVGAGAKVLLKAVVYVLTVCVPIEEQPADAVAMVIFSSSSPPLLAALARTW